MAEGRSLLLHPSARPHLLAPQSASVCLSVPRRQGGWTANQQPQWAGSGSRGSGGQPSCSCGQGRGAPAGLRGARAGCRQGPEGPERAPPSGASGRARRWRSQPPPRRREPWGLETGLAPHPAVRSRASAGAPRPWKRGAPQPRPAPPARSSAPGLLAKPWRRLVRHRGVFPVTSSLRGTARDLPETSEETQTQASSCGLWWRGRGWQHTALTRERTVRLVAERQTQGPQGEPLPAPAQLGGAGPLCPLRPLPPLPPDGRGIPAWEPAAQPQHGRQPAPCGRVAVRVGPAAEAAHPRAAPSPLEPPWPAQPVTGLPAEPRPSPRLTRSPRAPRPPSLGGT